MNHATRRPATDSTLRLMTALPFVLALAMYGAALAVWWDRLPDPVATHFSAGGGGRADGWTGLTAFAAIGAFLMVATGAGWTALVRRRVLWGAWATAGFTGTLLVLLLRDNLDAADATGVVSPLANLALAAGTAGLAALAGWALSRLVPEETHTDAPAPESYDRLPLGPSEVAGWSRDAGSGTLTALGAAFVLAGLVSLFLGPWPLALLLLVVGVPGLALARMRVTVDRRGLTVAPVLTARPRIRVPLDDVAAATVRDVDPVSDFGGWGYRVRAHRTGLVLRSGEALVVRREGGREFAVTVDDAKTAAALLNTLAARGEGV